MPESQTEQQYPGGSATVEQVLSLADEYRQAAYVLLEKRRRGNPLSLAPCRLVAIHAIELYLNALLQFAGHNAGRVRGLQHDLAARAELAIQNGLQLRKRTAFHITAMASKREYLITRYGPEMTGTTSEINRVMATLEEVSKKIAERITQQRSTA